MSVDGPVTGRSGESGRDHADVGVAPRSDTGEGPLSVEPEAPVNSANRYAHIDALRAAAVLLVLVQHAGLSIVPGDSGVTIFFAISGFIITTILLRERDRSGEFDIRRFYVRRFLKLAPPFFVVILVPTLVYALYNPVSWRAFLAQIFFSYNWIQIYDPSASYAVLPGTNIVWSLAVEEQFYIVFALVWLVLVRRRWWRRALVAVAAVSIVWASVTRVLLAVDGQATEHILRGTDVRMDAIAWGVLGAVAHHAWRGGARLRWLTLLSSSWTPVLAVAAMIAVSAVRSDAYEAIWRGSVIPVATVCLILFGLLPSSSKVKIFVYRVSTLRSVSLVGLASYSIYIAHYVVVEPLHRALADVPSIIGIPLLFVVGLAVGIAVYYAVERPVFRLRERRGL